MPKIVTNIFVIATPQLYALMFAWLNISHPDLQLVNFLQNEVDQIKFLVSEILHFPICMLFTV